MNAWLKSCFDGVQADLMTIALVLGILITLWILWHIQRATNGLDLTDLVKDTDGKASWTKITAIGAFLIASWGFIALIERDKMTDALFGLYIVTYSGAPVAYKYLAMKSGLPPDSAPTTVNVTTPPGQTTQVQTGPSPAGS